MLFVIIGGVWHPPPPPLGTAQVTAITVPQFWAGSTGVYDVTRTNFKYTVDKSQPIIYSKGSISCCWMNYFFSLEKYGKLDDEKEKFLDKACAEYPTSEKYKEVNLPY